MSHGVFQFISSLRNFPILKGISYKVTHTHLFTGCLWVELRDFTGGPVSCGEELTFLRSSQIRNHCTSHKDSTSTNSCEFQINVAVFWKSFNNLPSLKLTAFAPEKVWGWKVNFLLGFFRLFSGAIAVSFREGSQSKEAEKNGTQKNS